MTIQTAATSIEPIAGATLRKSGLSSREILALVVLGLLLVVLVPLFLCMGLYADFVNYEVYAQCFLHGFAVEEKANVYCKPPMMTWLLIGMHQVVGWRTEAVHALDFFFLAGVIGLLALWLKQQEVARAARIWFAAVCFMFYFSCSDWCHVQPDLWMLLPALGALHLRRRQVDYLGTQENSLSGTGTRALVEGFCWGLACLFKPFVIIPGGLCWLMSTFLIGKSTARSGRRLTVDAAGLFIGGSTAGVLWLAWLWWEGGLRYFLHDFKVWSGGYYGEVGDVWYNRILFVFTQFLPWGLVHAVAIPIAIVVVARVFTGGWNSTTAREEQVRPPKEALLAVFYLGWVMQANFVQFQYDYHLVPAVLLGLTLIARAVWRSFRVVTVNDQRWFSLGLPVGRVFFPPWAGWGAILALLVAVVVREPLLYPERLKCWSRCVTGGSTPELQDRLTSMDFRQFASYQWGGYWHQYLAPAYYEDLARVANFLRKQEPKLRDGDLTAYSLYATGLYIDLDVIPSTRSPFLSVIIGMYPDKLDLIKEELSKSHQRFIVSDPFFELSRFDKTPDRLSSELRLPDNFKEEWLELFPWNEPIVFRSGPYLVHEVTGPVENIGNIADGD